MEWEWTDSDGDVWVLCSRVGMRRAKFGTIDISPLGVLFPAGLELDQVVAARDIMTPLTWVNGGPLPEGAVLVGGAA